MDNNASGATDTWLLKLISAVAIAIGAHKLFSSASIWFMDPTHRVQIAVVLGLVIGASVYLTVWKLNDWDKQRRREAQIIGPSADSVFCGFTDFRKAVHIKTKQRGMHTQVIGTTNAGKTESVILPWAIQDIEQGRGLILIDGKSDRGLLDKLWAYTVRAGRENDFRLFSLSHIEESHQFNPLIGGTAEEVTERVFNSFEFENAHFRSLQFEIFSQVMRIFATTGETPTFLRLHQAITNPEALKQMLRGTDHHELIVWAENFRSLPPNERLQRTSGLTSAISHFAFGTTACLFNTDKPTFTVERALEENLIVYFQLPVLLSPFLGKASGKLILQCLQSAAANRHRGGSVEKRFFSVFLDDFSEYLYPGFVSILNKSRSANVGVVFAHQALGDIKTLGDAIANSILTNANLKIFMRGNDPDSSEYFSKVIGTVKALKFTERSKRVMFQQQATGDTSVREVDEFIIHPNRFKRELGVGEAVMVIPHETGSRAIEIKFRKYDDITPVELSPAVKTEVRGLKVITANGPKTKRI